jgi:plastocyanin
MGVDSRRMSTPRKPSVAAALVTCALGAPALVPAEAATPTGADAAAVRCSATVNVKIGDADGGARLFFSKRKVTIRAGSCVRWIWTGILPHNVDGPGFRSRTRSAPFRYRKRFAKARRTAASIICGIHPSMKMKVAVRPR